MSELHARLEEVLGAEPAGILMKQLPPESTPATRPDIERIANHLRAHDTRFDSLESRMDRVEHRMDRLDDRMHDLQGAMREQTRNYIVANAGLMVSLTLIAVGAAAVL